MKSRVDDAWRDASERFDVVVTGLRQAVRAGHRLPDIHLERTTEPGVSARIEKAPWGDVLVEIGDGFLGELLSTIEGLDESQLALLMQPPAGGPVLATETSAARLALFAVAEQFILHHELFHLLCGHLDQLVATAKGQRIALDETRMAGQAGVSRPFVGPMTAEYELLMFVELEADNSALQWLVDRCTIGDLSPLAPPRQGTEVPLSEVAPGDQAVPFRFCFAAVWLVLLLFERSGASEHASATHPWPSARLLSLIMTLMPYYVQGVEIGEDEEGRRYTVLNDETLEPTKAFLLDVVRPAMRFVAAHADGAKVIGSYEAADPNRSDLFADVLRDLRAILLDDNVTTPGGRQVLALLKKRREFAGLFADYSYVARSDLEEE